MRIAASVAVFIALSLSSAAGAETGVGRFMPKGRAALQPDAPALATFGDDVIRVRAYPSFTGAWLVQLHGMPDGSAEGEAMFFDHFSRASASWPRKGSMRLKIWRDDWPTLKAKVDGLIAEGQSPAPPAKPTPGLSYVCVTADGTSHEIERRRNGRDTWMTSQSGDDRCGGRDPSEAIAQLVSAAAAVDLCRAMQGSAPCERDGDAPPDAVARYREDVRSRSAVAPAAAGR